MADEPDGAAPPPGKPKARRGRPARPLSKPAPNPGKPAEKAPAGRRRKDGSPPRRIKADQQSGRRPCAVCKHPQRADIDAALVRGDPVRSIAARVGVNYATVFRHGRDHLPTKAMAEAAAEVAAAEGVQGAGLLAKALGLLRTAETILAEAKQEGDRANAIRALRECTRTIEVCAKLTGDIDTSTTINVTLAPVMIELQGIILAALARHPAARADVLAALAAIDGGGGTPLIEHTP